MMNRFRKLLLEHKAVAVVAVLLIGSGVIYGMVRSLHGSPAIPVFEVKRGEFLDVVQFRGEVKAMKSVTISAPADAGEELQILKIANTGTAVKQGDVVVEFDPSKTQQSLAQYQSALKSAQAEIEQVRAQSRLTEEADVTAVMKAQYDVEVAKLDASKGEIVSQIEGAEARLVLADREQSLHEVQEKLKSDRAQSKATVESKAGTSKKAAYDAQRAQYALTKMTLRAPSDGVVNLIPFWHQNNVSPYKAGERAWPGGGMAELPDASSLRIVARTEEVERGRLVLQQSATIQLDAVPDRQFTGSLARIGNMASTDYTAYPFPRNFILEVVIDQMEPRLKPGMSAQVTVVVDRIRDAITIPVLASFQKSGQTVAYVWDGSKFQERVIEVARRSRDRVLVSSGLRPGDRVALKDPSVKE